ncbi:MAG: DUF3168 domain-containing protein [Hyphomicrobiales bacterium]|nr:MAG: DUF3168 domain-containing protein [Hyphomicrobiales bacterium]
MIAGYPTGRPRVFPDVAPGDVGKPYFTYQQVGGPGLNFLNGIPDKRQGRFQVNVWSSTRTQAMSLIRQAEDALRLSSALNATTQGGAVAVYEDDTELYGARQDFAITFQA